MADISDFYARVSPYMAHRPGSALATKAHAWLVRRTGGRLGGRAFGAEILVLRTTGRRSGQQRDSPMFYLKYQGGFAVVASNGASRRPPAWWLNLQADPKVEAFVRGTPYTLVARAATEQEIDELWPKFVQVYSGYEHYKSIASRKLPVVVLETR